MNRKQIVFFLLILNALIVYLFLINNIQNKMEYLIIPQKIVFHLFGIFLDFDTNIILLLYDDM